MSSENLFNFTCPECEAGIVRPQRVHNYHTKVKGYPFVVEEAVIGVCDRCGAEAFAPQETRTWERLFYRSLEEQHAFLSPAEIARLRADLGLSMEDFARLIGCTRQSVSTWEKTDRVSPPSRMADLLMKLLRASVEHGTVDVVPFLLDEAKKWGLTIEVRRPVVRSPGSAPVVLHVKRSTRPSASEGSGLALAAASAPAGAHEIQMEGPDGRPCQATVIRSPWRQ